MLAAGWHYRTMSEPFDFDHFVAIPRLSGLKLSSDGRRLIVSVARPAPDGKSFRAAIWTIDADPAATDRPRRLTRSAKGESEAHFLLDGSVVFTSTRPDPDADPKAKRGGDKGAAAEDEPSAGLWLLPANGGEARLLIAPPGGVGGVRVAAGSGTLLFASNLHPAAESFDRDGEIESARKDAGIGAILFESFPIQFWDHYLGPRQARLFAADPPDPSASEIMDSEVDSGGNDAQAGGDAEAGSDDQAAEAAGSQLPKLRDLTGPTGTALIEPAYDIAADGSFVAATWRRHVVGSVGDDIVVIDRGTGERRVLTDGHGNYAEPAISPDGRTIACHRTTDGAPDEPATASTWLIDVSTGEGHNPAPDLDLWPHGPTWSVDGSAVFWLAERLGQVAILRLELATGDVAVLAHDGAYSDLCASPDGAWVYALRSTPLRAPHPVRVAARAASDAAGAVEELPFPGLGDSDLPRRGILERLSARADDGVQIESWLLRPADASPERPAPLVTFVHGGPVGAWSGWHWRWNPNLLVERGYAVLLPDPAFSVGYGQAFIDRGWARWHERPYTDVITAIDGALARDDLDSERTALMGGSFGGYMANWVAGQTTRFLAIVTHASLWELRGFHGATDDGWWWEQEFGDPYKDPSLYEEQSPSRNIGAIQTPMLVIHGERDARVPVSEALRLWTDLTRHGVEAKFLYFPDENHWILKPANSRLWYATVLGFLDQHVLGKEWVRPDLV
jgi:dipeptidyl aminopeptidase/acylaminoacyl peptidase